jgi:phage-related protein
MVEVIASATDIPCVDTLNLERTSRVKMVQLGDGYQQFVPDGINTENYRYSIETLPLSDTQSAAVEAALSALKGNIFYAKFKNDTQVYKYRLDGNRWSWRSSGQNANVFEFAVKRAYDL